jgi:Na+-transporting NADH:ubiquinone oxidoreductase subunit C
MLLVTAVFIAVVSGIYLATREIVIRNEQLFLKRAVLYSAGEEIPESSAQVEERYFERIEEVRNESGDIAYYRITAGDGGYVFPSYGPGVWGEIEAVVGFEPDLTTLTGVDFIKQNETPGLGARITEDWFRLQFKGKTGPFTRVPEGTESADPTEFDAITGATLTSTAVQNMLNKTISAAPAIVGRE